MADKDLHLSTSTVRESGTDQLHLSSNVAVMQCATFTEDIQRIANERFYIIASGGGSSDV